MTAGPTTGTETGTSLPPEQQASLDNNKTLSKKQLKKIQRWEKKMEVKQRRKEQERAAKEAKAKAMGRDLDEERRQQIEKHGKGRLRQEKLMRWTERLQKGSTFEICIDGSFESSMTAKEINSLSLQIRYCYATNRRCCNATGNKFPCRFTYTSAGGGTLKHLKNVCGFEQWRKWGFDYTPSSLEEFYKDRLSSVVYLTSDSEQTLEQLEDDKIYVIGGIVDRNRLRCAALGRAKELGIATAKLPIDVYLKTMPSTRVLTCNHVFDLLLKCREHKGDWKKSLMQVLPTRKDAQFDESKVLPQAENEGIPTDGEKLLGK